MKLLKVILLLLVLGFSCTKKKYPEELVALNEPVFYFKAKINNIDYKINAGVDNYRMYASNVYGTDSVYTFNADLKLNGCLNACPGSIKIQINDSKKTLPGQPVDIAAALKTQKYELITPYQKVDFFCSFNKGAKSYEWNFGDGSGSLVAHPSHVYTKPGVYNVCLTISDYYGCKSTICNKVRVGYLNKSNHCNISSNAYSPNIMTFKCNLNQPNTAASYVWSFGDGTQRTTIEDSTSHLYQYSGSYPVSVMVINANDTLYANYNVVTPSDNSSCAANFSVVALSNTQNSVQNILSKIVVNWVDASGELYTSKPFTQPYGSYFEIVSVEDYEPNENNEPTKKIKLKFNCNVYSGSKTIKIESAEAVLCVSYK